MKRWISLGIILALCTALPAFAEGANVYALNATRGAMLVSDAGETVVPMGKYGAITPLDGFDGLFAAEVPSDDGDGLWLVIDRTGAARTEALYQGIYAQYGTLIVVRDDRIGALDASLHQTVPCQYRQLVANGEGGFLGITSDPFGEGASGVYYVAPDGTETPTGIRVTNGLGNFGEGLMAVTSSDTSMTGYLNARGEWAITPQYGYGGVFRGGVADAAIDSGVGLIDKKGNWLLTPRYASLSVNTGDGTLIMAQEDNESVVLIDPDSFRPAKVFSGGEVYFTACFDNNRAEITFPDRTLLVNEKGDVLVEGGAETFFDTCAEMGDTVIARTGEWGGDNVFLLDGKGEKKAGPYQDARFLCLYEGKRYYIVSAFDVETETDEETGWTGLFAVEGTETYGVVGEDGKEALAGTACRQIDYLGDGLVSCENADAITVTRLGGDTLFTLPVPPDA